MLQHLWFKAIVICCCISSTLDLRLDLKQRMVKPLRLWLKVIVYGQPYFCVFIVPWSLWNSLEISDSHLTNPVVRSANIVTILVRIGLFFTFVRGIYQRNRKLEEWLQRALEMQKAYFDGLPEGETTGRSISHRKWLYPTSFITCLHYAMETCSEYKSNEARTLLYFMVTIQHFFMLTHGALVCFLRECFSVVYHELSMEVCRFPASRVYNLLHGLHRDLNEMHGPVMLCVLLSLLLSNSIVGYIGLLQLLMPNFNGAHFDYLFGNALYGLLLIHWYIYFMLCQRMETTIKEIDMVLYEYGDHEETKKEV